jgi:hypothetical protein
MMTSRCNGGKVAAATGSALEVSPRARSQMRPLAGELRHIAFASCYVYSPHGRGAIAAGSRRLRARLKDCEPQWLARYAARVHDLAVVSGRYRGLFGQGVVLVPVPGSRPRNDRTTWVAARLAAYLLQAGLADAVWCGLHRATRVRKSVISLAGRRPTVTEHFDSFRAERGAPGPGAFLLIDDIVTKGRTLLAAAMRLRASYPATEVRAFALVRTLGFTRGLEHLVLPCEGEIRWQGGDAWREP